MTEDVKTKVIHTPEAIDRTLLLRLFEIAAVPVTKTERRIIEGMPLVTDDSETRLGKLHLLRNVLADSVVLNADRVILPKKAMDIAVKETNDIWNELEDDE